MKRKRYAALVLALVLVCAALAGCGGKTEPSNTSQGFDWHSNIGRTDLNAQLFMDPLTFDPQMITSQYDGSVSINIFDGLFEIIGGDYNNIQPALCESYEVNESATDWVFHIRKGVTFQNGDPLTADDVTFTINRLVSSPVTATTYGGLYGAETIDDYTVHVVCNYPVFRLTSLLAAYPAGIVNKKLVEQYGDGTPEVIVGTGAYKLAEWIPGASVRLEAYNEGWRGAPAIQTINYTVILDTNAARIAFLNGELDTYYASSGADMEMLNKDNNFISEAYSLATGDHLVFNTTHPWVSDVKFREAVAHAIDRDALVKVVSDGLWTKAESIVSPDNIAYRDGLVYPYEYNPDKAKALLKEIGYDGSEIGLLFTSTYPQSNAWGTTVEGYLRAVGINVRVDGFEYGQVVSTLVAREFDLALLEYAVSSADPLSSYYALYRSDGFYNAWCMSSQEMDDLIISMYGMNDAQLAETTQAIDAWAQEQVLYVPCYFQGGYACYALNNFSTDHPEPMFGSIRICYTYWGDEDDVAERLAK